MARSRVFIFSSRKEAIKWRDSRGPLIKQSKPVKIRKGEWKLELRKKKTKKKRNKK